MMFPIASIVLGPLVLAGSLPAAGQPVPDGSVIQTAVTGDSSASRETYRQRADKEMQDWMGKLHDFTERWETKGQRQVDAADARLHVAWTDTENESQKLRTASAEGWDSAKAGFERSSHELAEAWDKVRR